MKDENKKPRTEGYKHRQIIQFFKLNDKNDFVQKDYLNMKSEGMFELGDEKR